MGRKVIVHEADRRHDEAMLQPNGFERPIKDIYLSLLYRHTDMGSRVLGAIEEYKKLWLHEFESPAEDDYLLWPALERLREAAESDPVDEIEMLRGLSQLLDFPTGRFNCGKISERIQRMRRERGYPDE